MVAFQKKQIKEKEINYPQLDKRSKACIGAKYEAWQRSVPHLRTYGDTLPFDFHRAPTAQAQWPSVPRPDRGRKSYSVYIDGHEFISEQPRFPRGHFFKTKTCDRLPKEERDKKKCNHELTEAELTPEVLKEFDDDLTETEYMDKVREKFQKSLGEDGLFYYKMLGECYVHGMMDGEAMAHQNNEGIPTTVFEIR